MWRRTLHLKCSPFSRQISRKFQGQYTEFIFLSEINRQGYTPSLVHGNTPSIQDRSKVPGRAKIFSSQVAGCATPECMSTDTTGPIPRCLLTIGFHRGLTLFSAYRLSVRRRLQANYRPPPQTPDLHCLYRWPRYFLMAPFGEFHNLFG